MTPLQHSSAFSYSLSKPYPFRWFTPVTTAGFIIFAALFSVLNFFSTGFVQVSQTSSDPNATVAGDGYLNRWPSFIFNMRPSCQPNNLPINSRFFTNQTALAYILTGAWQEKENEIVILPSLPYHNNVLENCVLTSAYLELSGFDQSAVQIAFSKYGVTINSFLTCDIQGENGTSRLNLTQTYNYVPTILPYTETGQFLGTNFLDRNRMEKASLWWGESLLSYYWNFLAWRVQEQQYFNATAGNGQIRTGAVWFTPSKDAATRSIDDPAYLDVDFTVVFIDYNAPTENGIITPNAYRGDGEDLVSKTKTLSLQMAQDKHFWPDIWLYADAFTKVAYSAILTDLGQVQSDINIASNPILLQRYSGRFKESFWQPNDTTRLITNARPGPAADDFESLKASTGPLGTTPAVISTQYLCTVPRRKSGGNLFVSILVADIVFLQVVWKLYTMIVGWTALKRVPEAEFCEGCGQQTGGQMNGSTAYRRIGAESSEPLVADTSGIELSPMKPAFRTSALSDAASRRTLSAQSIDQEGSLQ